MARMIERADEAGHRARLGRRDRAEALLAMAEHLPPADRLLLEAIYRDGRTIQDLARLCGRPRRSVGRRVNGLVRRVRSPLYRFVATRDQCLPAQTRSVARRCVLEGESLRRTAMLTGQSLHQVRQQIHAVRTMARLLD